MKNLFPEKLGNEFDAAFNQIRQFSPGSPAVIIRLMEALVTISKFTNRANYKKAVVKHSVEN